ncbi:sensor histidine kinase [Microlunatus soli]|uniref:histidine kinase n=1 Tax=Microlunatus soli TaxID=630515 RepID=A0A1H1T9R0_9ACTN|nr:histidine kinase [Microlunatus soli]SDS56873.1 Signal transduction histidine kinase [Microlunatus soli]
MERAAGWLRRVGVGFVRATFLAAAGSAVPIASLIPAFCGWLLGSPWTVGNVWSWVGWLIIAAALTVAAARPLGRLFRLLAARWAELSIDDGYRPPVQPVQLATGHWWNGHSYERTRRDAELDARWRRRWTDPAYWRDLRWVVVAALMITPICLVPIAGLVGAVIAVAQGGGIGIGLGIVLLLIGIGSSPYAWRILHPTADRWLRLPDRYAMIDRLRTVEAQRVEATMAQAAEIRRIERDLHDGAQARLIAVGLSLATAERLMDSDPDRAKALLREARSGTSTSLAELRELVRGVHPPVLVERGLVDAVHALALDSPLPVTVQGSLTGRLESPVEAALYFGVAELLANAGKYAPGAEVVVRIDHDGNRAVIDVEDDGPGGAVSTPGGGLDGVGRRIRSFDGALTLHSPPGGPTQIRMELPCALS